MAKGKKKSAAEKKRLLEEKKQKKLKEAEQNRARIRRDELAREMYNWKMQKQVLKENFDALITKMNSHWVRDEMAYRWAQFDKTVDLKDWYIRELKENIEKTELHFRLSQEYAMDTMDRIIGSFYEELDASHNYYVRKRNDITVERTAQALHFIRRMTDDIQYVEAAIEGGNDEQNKRETMYKEELVVATEERKEKSKGELDDYTLKWQLLMEKHWDDYQEYYRNYLSGTKEKRKLYTIVKERDEEDSVTIEKLTRKIERLHEKIESLKNYHELSKLSEKKIRDLTHERDIFANAYSVVRSRVNASCEQDFNQMLTLSRNASLTLKKFEGLKEKAENCLKLVTMCRKLETVEEKIIPYLEFSRRVNLPEETVLSDERDIDKLYTRISEVMLQNDYMRAILNDLERQNSEHKQELKDVIYRLYVVPDVQVDSIGRTDK